MFPEPESWANIVRDCKLTDAQANKLQITLQEALDDIDRYYSKPQNRPRDVLVKHLKRFEKSLKRLRNECRHSAELMEFFLPSDTLGFIGQSLTFSTKAGCCEKTSNLSPRPSGPRYPWQSCRRLHHGEVRRSVYRGPGRLWPVRKRDREGCSGCGQEVACRPSETAYWAATMIASAFDPKPHDIPTIFRDRMTSMTRSMLWHGRLTSEPQRSLARCARQGATTPDFARAPTSQETGAWVVRGSRGPSICGRKRSFRRYARPRSGARCHHPSAWCHSRQSSLLHRTQMMAARLRRPKA